MTGQYGQINGVRTLAHRIAKDYNPFLSTVFQKNGYSQLW